jgi:hypothetical protein
MNKKSLLIIGPLLVVLATFLYFLYQQKETNRTEEGARTPAVSTPTPTSTTSIEPGLIQSYGQVDIFGDRKDLSEFENMVLNSAGVEISFQERSTGARNSATDIFIEGEEIGTISGQDAAIFSSSPDGNLFSFRYRAQTGCCSSNFYIYVIDTIKNNLIRVSPPGLNYSSNEIEFRQKAFPVIESYEWENISTLKITAYFSAFLADGTVVGYHYYRISPKEIWRYDLMNGQYILLETLEE